MTVIRFGNNRYEGLTADTKPTNVPAGSLFRDTELDVMYEFNGTSWDAISNSSGGGSITIGGTVTKSGNAVNKVFSFPHNLTTTPVSAIVTPTSTDALGDFVTTIDPTNITITYQLPPPSGTNNLTYNWMAADAITWETIRYPYTYIIYPSGTTDFKVMRCSDGAVVYTSNNGGTADALGALQHVRNALGNTSPGGAVALTEGYFPVSATFTLDGNSHRYQKYKGISAGSSFGALTEIRALGNFPAITINGTTNSALGFGLEGIHLTHDEATYTNGLIRCLDTVIECTFTNLSFNDMAGNTGDCFKFEILNTSAIETQYENKIFNCNARGFDNFIHVNNQANSATHGSFISTMDINNCNVWNAKRVLKVAGVSGALVLDWHFNRVNFQHSASNTVAANQGIFDYDSPVSCWQHKHSNCLIWDITAPGINYANVGTSVELSLIECNPSFMIGGSGAYLNKVKANEYYMGGFGPMNTGWFVGSGTTNAGDGLLQGTTISNPSSPTQSQDSNAPYLVWASGTTQGTNTGPRRGPSTIRMEHRPLLEIYASPSSTTLSRCYYGIGTNVVLGDTDTIIGTTDSGIFAGWRPGDTNIQIFHHDGDGSAMTVIDTGLAKTTSLWKCAFLINATSFQWLVATPSGSKVSAPVSTQIPAQSTNMAISAQAQNTTTTSINNQVRYVKLVLRGI